MVGESQTWGFGNFSSDSTATVGRISASWRYRTHSVEVTYNENGLVYVIVFPSIREALDDFKEKVEKALSEPAPLWDFLIPFKHRSSIRPPTPRDNRRAIWACQPRHGLAGG